MMVDPENGLTEIVADYSFQESGRYTHQTSFRHSSIKIEELGWRNGRPWRRLLEPLVIEWEIDGNVWRIYIPAGFETDYASTPRLLWWLLPPDGPWTPAAIAHDYLYRHGKISRFFADAAFYDAMVGKKVSFWARTLLFCGVCLFGGRWYRVMGEHVGKSGRVINESSIAKGEQR